MNKAILVEAICKQLEIDLEAMKVAAKATHDAATNEESTPENEYDTRALEASYLAGAQAKRAAEIERQLLAVRKVEIKEFNKDEPIAATALVEVEHNGKNQFLFLMPGGGGLTLSHDGNSISVITPNSPLGQALVGNKAGDEAVIQIGARIQEYEILGVS